MSNNALYIKLGLPSESRVRALFRTLRVDLRTLEHTDMTVITFLKLCGVRWANLDADIRGSP